MIDGILGKKLGMSQVYLADGVRVPVTVVETGPCTVVQKKTVESDGYSALQLGFLSKKAHRTSKPMMGHFKKVGKGAFANLKEVRIDDPSDYEIGEEITCEIFTAGESVDVVGTSKGKGFQGVIKRWHFAGGRASHGSQFHRTGGSIGCSAYPSRVFKGKKMAGQMGNERSTVQNLEVIEVRSAQNLVLIKGAIPGPKNGIVLIKRALKSNTPVV